MLAPQSDDEVRPVVAAIQAAVNDARLDVLWEPRAVLVQRGHYDARGHLMHSIYAGRWRLVRYNDPSATQTHRGFTHIAFITQPTDIAIGIRAFQDNGPYAPVGEWLVEFMRMADHLNRMEWSEREAQLDAINERAEREQEDQFDDALYEGFDREFHRGTQEGGVSQFSPVNISFAETLPCQ